MGGDQLGTRAILTIDDKKPITYHVKTHSLGLQSQHSSASKTLDSRELMVYKILENFNVGCETHFFGRDLSNFYIATKDAGADGSFHTYRKIKDDSSTLKAIIGNLSDLEQNESVEPDEQAQSFINGMMCLDLLSRILRLTDLQTNTENFGFVVDAKGIFKIKAIDFRVQAETNFEITEEHFKGFLKGNGSFQYSATDEYIYYVLKERNQEKRVLTAKNIFHELFSNFQEVLKKSQQETKDALNNTFNKNPEKMAFSKKVLITDLLEYTDALNHNFKFFQEKLNQ
jgi:hypothetical protein